MVRTTYLYFFVVRNRKKAINVTGDGTGTPPPQRQFDNYNNFGNGGYQQRNRGGYRSYDNNRGYDRNQNSIYFSDFLNFSSFAQSAELFFELT